MANPQITIRVATRVETRVATRVETKSVTQVPVYAIMQIRLARYDLQTLIISTEKYSSIILLHPTDYTSVWYGV